MKSNNNNNSAITTYVKRYKDDDGEDKEEELLIKCKKSYKYKEEYFSIFQGAYMEKKLTLGDFKSVFGNRTFFMFYLLNNMYCGNLIPVSRKKMQEDTGLSKQEISRHLKALADIEMIRIDDKNIHFNKEFIYKGKVKDHPNIMG